MNILRGEVNQGRSSSAARFGSMPAGRRSASVRLVAFVLSFWLLFVSGPRLRGQDPIVRQLAPGVFYYWGDELQQKSANCVWVVFRDYVLAVDANYPWGAQEILAEIKKTTGKPVRFLFDTHYHDDHTMGNSVFGDAGKVDGRDRFSEVEGDGGGVQLTQKSGGEQVLAGVLLHVVEAALPVDVAFDFGADGEGFADKVPDLTAVVFLDGIDGDVEG